MKSREFFLYLQTVSGRPPPATSMGVGQFFNPKDGEQVFPHHWLIHSSYLEKVEILNVQLTAVPNALLLIVA